MLRGGSENPHLQLLELRNGLLTNASISLAEAAGSEIT